MRYSTERKEALLKKMLPPHNRSILELAKAEGISDPTLYVWCMAARVKGRLLPHGAQSPAVWTVADKFSAVVETAALNEAEQSAWCRERGLYPDQIHAWRRGCEQANDWDRQQVESFKAERKADRERLMALKRELKKKEKALAESAALLVLSKNAEAIWGDGGEE